MLMLTFSTADEARNSITFAICASGDVTPDEAERVANQMWDQWIHSWCYNTDGVQRGNPEFYVASAEIQAETYSELIDALEEKEYEQREFDAFWETVGALLDAEAEVTQ